MRVVLTFLGLSLTLFGSAHVQADQVAAGPISIPCPQLLMPPAGTVPNAIPDIAKRLVTIDIFFQGTSLQGTCTGIVIGGSNIITAGHCFNPLDGRYPVASMRINYPAMWTTYFNWGKIWQYPVIDFGFLENTGLPKMNQNLFIPRTDIEMRDLLESAKKQGKCVNIWGRFSGQKCGKILGYNFETNLLVLDTTIQPGDSGGPVWIDGHFIGVIKGDGRAANVNAMSVSFVYLDLFANQTGPLAAKK